MDEVYVFDLGNVMVIPMNIEMLYEKLKCKVSYGEFLTFFKYDKSVIDAHKGLISDEEHIQKLLEFAKSKKTIEEYKAIYVTIRNGLFKDTSDIIERLKRDGKRVYLLSNLRKIDFDWFQTIYDVSKFDDLFLSYEMHINKPDKKIYEQMIQKLKIDPNLINFFDDMEENIKSAKECGIKGYCVTGKNIKEVFEKIYEGEKI